MENFRAKLDRLNDNLISYSTMLDSFTDGNAKLEAAISHVNYEIPIMQKRMDTTADSPFPEQRIIWQPPEQLLRTSAII